MIFENVTHAALSLFPRQIRGVSKSDGPPLSYRVDRGLSRRSDVLIMWDRLPLVFVATLRIEEQDNPPRVFVEGLFGREGQPPEYRWLLSEQPTALVTLNAIRRIKEGLSTYVRGYYFKHVRLTAWERLLQEDEL